MTVTKLKSSATRSRKTVADGVSEGLGLTPNRSHDGKGFTSASGQKIIGSIGRSLTRKVTSNLD